MTNGSNTHISLPLSELFFHITLILHLLPILYTFSDLRSLYSQLRDVSIMDPYLPVVLVYILPVKELDSFLHVLPTFLAFCGITKRLYDFEVQKEHTERLVSYK